MSRGPKQSQNPPPLQALPRSNGNRSLPRLSVTCWPRLDRAGSQAPTVDHAGLAANVENIVMAKVEKDEVPLRLPSPHRSKPLETGSETTKLPFVECFPSKCSASKNSNAVGTSDKQWSPSSCLTSTSRDTEVWRYRFTFLLGRWGLIAHPFLIESVVSLRALVWQCQHWFRAWPMVPDQRCVVIGHFWRNAG